MTPLVVRPAIQAAELVQLLHQHGHAPLCCPLLETVAGSELLSCPTCCAVPTRLSPSASMPFILHTIFCCKLVRPGHILSTLRWVRPAQMRLQPSASRQVAG